MFSETNIIDEDTGIYAGKLVMSVYPPINQLPKYQCITTTLRRSSITSAQGRCVYTAD